jgi:hypothetical protein
LRAADYLGVLFRSHLVKFAGKAETLATDDPDPPVPEPQDEGPIGMDEMADARDESPTSPLTERLMAEWAAAQPR